MLKQVEFVMNKVLITRAKEQADEFGSLLLELGLEPIFFPTIEIVEPESWSECDEQIKRLGDYTDLIFTSTNSVLSFLKRVEPRGGWQKLKEKTFHAVGSKTKRAIEEFGFSVAPLPDQFTAAQLAETIRSGQDSAARRFLFPCGNLSDNTLVDRLHESGLQVDPIIVYRTIKPEMDARAIQTIKRQLMSSEIAVVTFFSPSSVKNFLETFPELLVAQSNTTIAVIGETTAKACRERGLKVDLLPSDTGAETPTRILAQLIHDGLLTVKLNERD
jgi:uroporphyrinogen-III synthase